MKRIMAVILLCVFILGACGSQEIKDADRDNNDEKVIENVENHDPVTNGTGSISGDKTQNSNSAGGGNGYCVPKIYGFDTKEKVIALVDAVNKGDETLAQFIQENDFMPYENLAKKMAKNIESNVFPMVKDWSIPEAYGMDYSYDGHVFDIIYRVDDVRYGFKMAYDSQVKFNGELPLIATVSIGDIFVDLYANSTWIVGAVQVENTAIYITYYSQELDKMDFSPFVLADYESFRSSVVDSK